MRHSKKIGQSDCFSIYTRKIWQRSDNESLLDAFGSFEMPRMNAQHQRQTVTDTKIVSKWSKMKKTVKSCSGKNDKTGGETLQMNAGVLLCFLDLKITA